MKVKGYEAQNMSLFLARAEEEMNPAKFNQHLLHQQELDPDNFVVGTAKVAGERRAVVLGGHAVCRGSKRLYCASPDRLLELAVKTLENPLVGGVVYDHPVGLEDKKNHRPQRGRQGLRCGHPGRRGLHALLRGGVSVRSAENRLG